MGHYKKKQYKKKPIDLWLQRDFEYEMQEAIKVYDSYEDLDIFEEELLQTTMTKEPLIIRQLRNEERHGKLPLLIIDPNKEQTLRSLIIDLTIHMKIQTTSIMSLPDNEEIYNRATKIIDSL